LRLLNCAKLVLQGQLRGTPQKEQSTETQP